MKEGVTRVTALRTGEVDFANWIPREHVERLAKDPQMQMLKGERPSGPRYFNLRKPAFPGRAGASGGAGLWHRPQAIAKTALLGLAQPCGASCPRGRGSYRLWGAIPLRPREGQGALLKEAGYDEKNPLRYTLMTHAAEAALPTIATIMKTQFAKIGVEVTVEVIDRPIFLRRLTPDRDWDQILNFSGGCLDTYSIDQANRYAGGEQQQ